MQRGLGIEILKQPDLTTCGPACLHALYSYYGDDIPLGRVIDEVRSLKGGGTLEVFLACHALMRGYSAKIYTYNLNVFDPSWFEGGVDIREKLMAQMEAKDKEMLHTATRGYLEFLRLGGKLRFEDLTTALIRRHLSQGAPLLAGLSSTYLYRSPRETWTKGWRYDDIKGAVEGHFVVLSGYNRFVREVRVADPFAPNPLSESHYYSINIDRVLCAILLGVLTYEANLLVIKPDRRKRRTGKSG